MCTDRGSLSGAGSEVLGLQVCPATLGSRGIIPQQRNKWRLSYRQQHLNRLKEWMGVRHSKKREMPYGEKKILEQRYADGNA